MGSEKEQLIEEQLNRLQHDREALSSRLASLDARLAALQAARYEAVCERLTALEATTRVVPAPPSAAPLPSAPPLVPVAASLPSAPPPVPVAAASLPSAPPPVPVAAASRPSGLPPAPVATAAMPAVPAPRPRIVADVVADRHIVLSTAPDPMATVVGSVQLGARVLVTDDVADGYTRVIYLDRPAWVRTPDLAWTHPQTTPAVPAQPLPPRPAAAPATGPRPPAPPRPPAGPPVAAVPPAPPPVAPVRPPAPPEPPLWRRPGFTSRLLALVGAAVTLIGVTFLLILAAQYGYFGPEARTLSAAGLGIVLVVLAFLVHRRDPRNVGAPILAATGIAAGFLSVVVATVTYAFLDPIFGANLVGLLGLGGAVLARRWENQWLALVAVLGGLVLAGVVGRPDAWTAGLMVMLTAITLWVERGTGWRMVPFARVLPTAFALLVLVADPMRIPYGQDLLVVGLCVAFALLGLVSALIAPAEPAVGQTIALGLLVPMVVPAALTGGILGDDLDAAIVLGGLAVAFVLPGFLPFVNARARWATVPIGAGLVALAVLTATHQRFWGVLAFVMAAAYLAIAARTKSLVNLLVGEALGVIGLIGWLPLVALTVSPSAAAQAGLEQVVQSVCGIAAVVTITLAAHRWIAPRPALIYLPWAGSIVMGSVAVILGATSIGVWVGNDVAGFQTGQAIVTSAWMGLCVLFLHRGLTARGEADTWLRLALTIAALAVAKLFLFDLGMLDAIARVGAFLAVGLLLLFVGTRYAKAWERARAEDRDQLPGPPAPPEPEPAALAPAVPAPPAPPAQAPSAPAPSGEATNERPVTFEPPRTGPPAPPPAGP